jgi:dTDP-4-amino-4,6-dideoxygalactose transaminase
MKNAFEIVKDFENAVAEYTGAPYCVSVNSCTNALFLSLYWNKEAKGKAQDVNIPKFTYVSVPAQIKNLGLKVSFRDEPWSGSYQLRPYQIYDSARRFTSNMYKWNTYQCVSFHWSKILGIQQGGAILHNDKQFDSWARKARFDGRTEGVKPKNDQIIWPNWHMYLSPEIAAEGLVRLMHLPKNNPDLPPDEYPDLSTLEVFK